MKESKIITDILFDYPNLKYMFQYGFYWDDRATDLVLSKTSQTLRTMMDLLAESVYKNCVWTPWYTHVRNGQAKKSARRMIWNNHYRLGQNPWFLNLYGCYGKEKVGIRGELRTTTCYKDGNCYSACKLSGDDDDCDYKKYCHIIELKKMFCELAEGSGKKDSVISRSNCFKEEILEQYQDVLTRDQQKGCYRLKDNTWTREAMSASGIIDSEEEYVAFLNMIRFFANFAPLSVLGAHFLHHLKEECVSPYFFVRNLPLDFALEQEYVYRILYAIIHHYSIRYENTEYMPVAIVYGGKDLSGLAEHLYLDAVEVQGEALGTETVRLPLECGKYLEVGAERDTVAAVQVCIPEDVQKFEVAFYYNNQTEYLENRRKEGWKQQIVEEQPKVECCEFVSPYYPEDTSWYVDIVIYEVEGQDVPGFLDFIDSFGDFAKLLSGDRAEYKTETVYRGVKQGKAKEYQSLFSLYNSEELVEMIDRPLPPREAELEWLLFVLEKYPNLCRIFMGEETLQRITQKVKAEQSYEGWFDASYYRYDTRCRDIEKRMVEKYRNIIHAVKNRHVLHYCYCEEAVKIFPYALEYDMTRHLTGYRNPPINIMCYSLTEKRTINVKYGSKGQDGGYLQTKNQTLQKAVSFSELDRLYHALAYVIRCGMEEKAQIEDQKLSAFLDCLWTKDTRSNVDNYNRCVRKRLNRKKNYVAEFDKLQAAMTKAGDQEGEEYLDRVFAYWKGQTVWTPLQQQYQTMLLVCFRQGYERLHASKSCKQVRQCLEQISDMELWEFICGDERDGVPNEIAFYNEKLNNAEVSFVIKREDSAMVERIYRLFRNFLCSGEILDDNRIRFTVTYERFYYRKIHMLLMVIADLVEELEPEEVAEVIGLRKKNKEEQRR